MSGAAIEIRNECSGDEAAIHDLLVQAFGRASEANCVWFHRLHYPGYQRQLSFCAWEGGRLVGHVLLSPARLRLMGAVVPALGVAPLAVMPDRQGQGIGGQLLRAGHEHGRQAGYALAFLFGNPAYYKRHGYRPVFGFPDTHLDLGRLPPSQGGLQRRPVTSDDLAWLVARQEVETQEVDFSWLWGAELGEWSFPPIECVMWWTSEGRRAGYTVMTPGGARCALLLADEPQLARRILTILRPAKLDHHPQGWLARQALDPVWSTCGVKRSGPPQALALQPGVLDAYLRAVNHDGRPVGMTTFPLGFIGC